MDGPHGRNINNFLDESIDGANSFVPGIMKMSPH